MTITAKYAGRCRCCGGAITVGEPIAWQRGHGASHVACPAVESVSPEPGHTTHYAAPRSGRRGGHGPCHRCGTYCYGDCTASQS